MPSDRDRISFDPTLRYRGVIAQQGRVALPADFNEAQEIAADEQREQTLDVVGPAGTPDNGFEVSIPSSSAYQDFTIGAGTMYVGGLRAWLPEAITYLDQPDWLTRPEPAKAERELICLQLEEIEVGAGEDGFLRDAALGGPDSSQRSRLLQRIVRFPVEEDSCTEALKQVADQLAADNWQFDPTTMRVTSLTRLQVGFEQAGVSDSPCEPTATGGYLSAENQLIRVRTSDHGRLLWAFDNASTLYRTEVIDPQTLRLLERPLDSFHFPQVGHIVEVLRASARLSNGEYLAESTGMLFTIGQAYNPDTQSLRLPAPLPASHQSPGGTPRLFVRVWEQELPYVVGVPVSLGTTGVQATVTSSGPIHSGDAWAIALRPDTPIEAYPNRYLAAPQSPETPQRWLCPLAVIYWNYDGDGNQNGQVLSDCRIPFDNLVTLTGRRSSGCCTVTLSPREFDGGRKLQQIIDSLPPDVPARICFSPGEYNFEVTIRLRRPNTSFEACPGGVLMQWAEGFYFPANLFWVAKTQNISFKGIRFRVTPMISEEGLFRIPFDLLYRYFDLQMEVFGFGVAIFAAVTQHLEVDECEFEFLRSYKFTNQILMGIRLGGTCSEVEIRNCRFVQIEQENENPQVVDINAIAKKLLPIDVSDYQFAIFLGIVHTHGAKLNSGDTNQENFEISGEILPARLEQANIANNHFQNLSAATLIRAFSTNIHLENNTVVDCHSGLWLLGGLTFGMLDQLLWEHKTLADGLEPGAFFGDPILSIAAVLAAGLTLPSHSPGIWLDPFWFGNSPPFPIRTVSPIRKQFHGMWYMVTQAEKNLLEKVETPSSIWSASGNQIVCLATNIETNEMIMSGPGLILFGDATLNQERLPDTTALVGNNAIQGRRHISCLAAVAWVTHVTATGNTVLNDAPDERKRSLVIYSTNHYQFGKELTRVAVTGNVLQGPLLAPTRPLPSPFDNWNVLNTEFW